MNINFYNDLASAELYRAVITSPKLGRSSPNCKLKIFYNNQDPLSSQLNIILHEPMRGSTGNIFGKTNQTGGWIEYLVNIGQTSGFQLTIIGYIDNRENRTTLQYFYLALDNIQLIYCNPFAVINSTTLPTVRTTTVTALHTTTTTPLLCGTTSQFMCKTSHLCIDRSKV